MVYTREWGDVSRLAKGTTMSPQRSVILVEAADCDSSADSRLPKVLLAKTVRKERRRERKGLWGRRGNRQEKRQG